MPTSRGGPVPPRPARPLPGLPVRPYKEQVPGGRRGEPRSLLPDRAPGTGEQGPMTPALLLSLLVLGSGEQGGPEPSVPFWAPCVPLRGDPAGGGQPPGGLAGEAGRRVSLLSKFLLRRNSSRGGRRRSLPAAPLRSLRGCGAGRGRLVRAPLRTQPAPRPDGGVARRLLCSARGGRDPGGAAPGRGGRLPPGFPVTQRRPDRDALSAGGAPHLRLRPLSSPQAAMPLGWTAPTPAAFRSPRAASRSPPRVPRRPPASCPRGPTRTTQRRMTLSRGRRATSWTTPSGVSRG